MRGLVPRLPSPHPLGRQLPALYQEDGLTQRLLEALDEVLAPVLCTLDGLDAHFDPRLAPEDFLAWLAGWVGVELDETWPTERRRALVAGASRTYRLLGTARGLRTALERFVDGEVEIEDSGGTAWSAHSGGALPGAPALSMVVRLKVDDPAAVPRQRLEALVAAASPAHVAHRIEVVQR
jgi:phage tail-like protein